MTVMDKQDYVKFECIHITDADQNDPNERQALAYAEIDGYPVDENAQGTVICRVWLMKNKEGIYPTYLVDWHYNGYRENKSVLDLIKQVKTELIKYKDNMVEEVFQSAYNKYKLQWMLDHNHTLDELITKLKAQMKAGSVNVEEAFINFVNESGFSGELWACQCEFRDTEWEDEEYMRSLLNSDEYAIWMNKE